MKTETNSKPAPMDEAIGVFPECSRVATLSTSHLPEAFGRGLIEQPDYGLRHLMHTSEYGSMFYTSGMADEAAEDDTELPVEVRTILTAALEAGIRYVYFDRDGPVSAAFPTFDW